MARRRYSRRRYYNKTRWSPNIKELNTSLATFNAPANDTFWFTNDLCFNPIQNDNTVSQQYTVKNIEVTIEISTTSGSSSAGSLLEDMQYYIMYVPQGMLVTSDYNMQHPEYIMAYQFIGSPTNDVPGNNGSSIIPPRKIRTRLSRRLQTGDSIVVFVKGRNPSSNNTTYEYHGLVRWWTKAN